MELLLQIKITNEAELITRAQEADAIMKDRGVPKVTDRSAMDVLSSFMDPKIPCDIRDSERAQKLSTNQGYLRQEFMRDLKFRDPKAWCGKDEVNPHEHVLPREKNRDNRPYIPQNFAPNFGANRGGFGGGKPYGQQHQRAFGPQHFTRAPQGGFQQNYQQNRYPQSQQQRQQSYGGGDSNYNRNKVHYKRVMTPSKEYYNSRTYYNINRSNQQSRPYYPNSTAKQAPQQTNPSRGGSTQRTAQTGSANVAAQATRNHPIPNKRTAFKHSPSHAPQRFSKHAEAFMMKDEEYITTFEKSACPGGDCEDPECGDNDSSGDDGDAYFAETGNEEETYQEEESIEGFTAGESEN